MHINNFKILIKSKHIPTYLGGSHHYHQGHFNLYAKKQLFEIDFIRVLKSLYVHVSGTILDK